MDFLDPKKQRQHTIQLAIGYVLIAIAIAIATVILLVIAYGYGRGKDGEVVQRGIVFFSSAPSGAAIQLNGGESTARTNTRQQLIGGNYDVTLTRSGYRIWHRPITIEGGAIAHYDYPFLFPVTLKTSSVKTYTTAPGLATQSPNQRWLLVQHPDDSDTFDVFDRDNLKSTATTATLPSTVVTSGSATQSWEAVEWASDNDHVLLKHTYDDKSEFIIMDRSNPDQSVNLNSELSVNPTELTLRNKKYDQYYVFDAAAQTLQTASLGKPTPEAYLDHVLNYQSYGSDVMLYASSASSGKTKVSIDLLQDGKTYNLREVAVGSTYLLNLTQYSHAWYVAVGASSESKVYVYRNPVTQLNSKLGVLVPTAILKTAQPNYLAFSDNTRFITSENGSQFSVYDAENDKSYSYDTKAVLDAPQAHASWMDGHRLTYVSGGKLLVFDYDHQNVQTLMPASPDYTPFFTSDYKSVDAFTAPNQAGQMVLTTTSLRTPTDQ